MKNKRIISLAMAVLMGASLLTSCAQKEPFDFDFAEEEKSMYTSVVEGSALTIYVDANANDSGDGSEVAPYKSIPEAQAKIREIKAGDGLPAGGITVLVKDGQYEPISFTEEDSGTAESTISYVSENKLGAVISGGLILTAEDFEPLSEDEKSRLVEESARNNVVKVDLKKKGVTKDEWGQIPASGVNDIESYDETIYTGSDSEVFIDGKRQVLARYPNNGDLLVTGIVSLGSYADYYGTNETAYEYTYGHRHDDYTWRNIRNPEGCTFNFSIEAQERISKWSSTEGVWMNGNPRLAWATIQFPFEYIDVENREAKLKYASIYGVGIGGKYYMFNIFDELDVEGEYFLDRENGILYVYKTEDFENAEIAVSLKDENIIDINKASYLTFKGFDVCYTKGNGVNAVNCESLNIDSCRIRNVRTSGAFISGYRCTLQNSEITSTGSTALSLNGGNITELIKSEHLIYNNYIHNFAELGAWIGGISAYSVVGATISHNEICDSDYPAMEFGAMTIVEYNDIYDVSRRVGADMGAVYNLHYYAGAVGAVFRYNYLHDIVGTGEGTFNVVGLYWDACTSFWSAYGNVFENINGHAVQCGGGRGYLLENNVFINCKKSTFYSANVYPITMYETRVDNDYWYDRVQPLIALLETTPELKELYPALANVDMRPLEQIEDPEDPNLFAYAVGEIRNNITYYTIQDEAGSVTSPVVWRIDEKTYAMNDGLGNITNNYVIRNDMSDFPGYNNGDFTMATNASAKELCPDFEPIPFDQIGRVN